MRIPTIVLGIILAIPTVAASNITIDNTSPLVVYSPTPCYLAVSTDCSAEWLFTDTTDDFLGSSTTTTGPNVALGLTVVPRVSLTFQGSSVVFKPGKQSTAAATIVIDNLTSILVNTSLSAFAGAGLDPFSNHTITITFVPSDKPTSLDIDYFIIEQPVVSNVTSSSTIASTIFPTTIPTSPSTTSTTTPAFTSTQLPNDNNNNTQPAGTPAGTIAGVSVSGTVLLLFAALTWFLAIRRRRRRTALQREKAILYDLRLPSERHPKEHPVSRWGEVQRDLQRERQGDLEDDLPWHGTDRREKGKGREKTWRESILPPVHYTPWR